ncbi:SapC family protein [Thalassotalea litorea]|uniref:SapC family protein n=1 Tax=Thalassotalea litorea TaxID=2020715 RepID=UPI003735C4C2
MASHALLNNIDHKDLKIDTKKSAEFGNNKMFSVLYPFEFKHAQADYPIFFFKDGKTNDFVAIALFGFEENENLFLTNEHWQASYIPMMIEREPFLIGTQIHEENGVKTESQVIHIDLNNPRVNKEVGNDIFLPHGGNSEYINRVSAILKSIHDSKTATDQFMQAITELELLEPFNLDIQLNNGTNNRLSGFYTINEDKLANLNGVQLEKLNKSGMLSVIYMVIASHANINALIQKKDNQ